MKRRCLRRSIPLNTDKMTWENPSVDIYPPGTKEKTLWRNPETGASILMIKYPEGALGKNHKHLKANEAGFYLQAELEGQDVTGWFRVNLKGVEHSARKWEDVPRGYFQGENRIRGLQFWRILAS